MNDTLRKPRLTFHQKLLMSITTTIVVFVVMLSLFQYQREKSFRIELLTDQIISYNNLVYEDIQEHGICDSCLVNLMSFFNAKDLRITVVDFSGNVLFDSQAEHLSNHSNRPEIKEALSTGNGVSIRRNSQTLGKPFFYVATRYDNLIVRCSRPYDFQLHQQLKTDNSFLIFTTILLIVLLFFIFRTTRRMGNTIEQLRDFAQHAEKGNSLDMDQDFPNNELGEISQHIVGLFKRISTAKDELVSEREKLYTHLQTAREGLAVFSPEKKEIISNNLFIQYMNLISTTPVNASDSIFELPEMEEINHYLEHNLAVKNLLGHLQRHSIQIYKNGKMFLVQCIIFQDNSFEISITDITLSEEETSLKRQLTQNIAHELKTPISSIQGYLETILENQDLPDEKRNKFIERSYLQSKRLGDLLRDISTLTRMDEAPRLIEKEPVNLTNMLTQLFAEVENEAHQKNIRLIMDIPAELHILGNPSLLYSIFRNLMDNALAYGGENIEVGVRCFRNDMDRSYFLFYDTGEGIAEEHLNRIFERFYRIDKGRTRKLGGTGLGLAIVKNAVQLHGGSISAKNRENGGLEVIFSLTK